jgi:hypothetical protein
MMLMVADQHQLVARLTEPLNWLATVLSWCLVIFVLFAQAASQFAEVTFLWSVAQ